MTGAENSEKVVRRRYAAKKTKDQIWLRRRTEMNMKRRKRMQLAERHLKSNLLISVKPDDQKAYVPSLIGALDTLKDAWSPDNRMSFDWYVDDQESSENAFCSGQTYEMKRNVKASFPLAKLSLGRRSSVPEEIMRKYSMKKVTSEESETNQTVPEVTSASSKDRDERPSEELIAVDVIQKQDKHCISPSLKDYADKREARSVRNSVGRDLPTQNAEMGYSTENEKAKPIGGSQQYNIGHESHMSANANIEKLIRTTKRLTQCDYNRQGKGIIKLKNFEICLETETEIGRSETTPTAKEDTEDSLTTESLPSSSPIELPRKIVKDISTSGNLSSESEGTLCTCAELTSSKATSTDIFHSANSTLSQTASEKSISTQDSTVSINSVSTGGSIMSANSNSTSPDTFARASAKDTTTPEHTPRRGKTNLESNLRINGTLRNTHRRSLKYHLKRGTYRGKKLQRRKLRTSNRRRVRMYKEILHGNKFKGDCSMENSPKINNETEDYVSEQKNQEASGPVERNKEIEDVEPTSLTACKCTPEEVYMIQQLRHRKFMENYRRFSIPLPAISDVGSLSACAESGSVYRQCLQLDDFDDHFLIPRYSALPRTLSMLVNTSSNNTSAHNSDSDSLSLADSLEEVPVTHSHRLSFDTKKELKPVRGDVNAVPESRKKNRRTHLRPKAFFISIKNPYGEDELISGIDKIPTPPEKIVRRIRERQINIIRMKQKNSDKRRKGFDDEVTSKKLAKNMRSRKRIEKEVKLLATRERPSIKNRKPLEEMSSVNCRAEQKSDNRKKPNATNKTSKLSGRKYTSEGIISRHLTPTSGASDPTSLEEETKQWMKTKPRKEREAHINTTPDGKDNWTVRESSKTKFPDIAGEQPTSNVEKTGETLQVSRKVPRPQAVIHPSQIHPSEPEAQRRNKQTLTNQSRTMKFRQRFEVIPEEKSSSISSTEENRPCRKAEASLRASLKELSTGSAFPANPIEEEQEKSSMSRSDSENISNLFFAELKEMSLQEKGCFRRRSSSNPPIILFSPKDVANANSRKGRDALIAMNREDFKRLSKGWMNFYILKETSDNSDNSEQEEKKESHRNSPHGKDKIARTEEKNNSANITKKIPSADKRNSGVMFTEKEREVEVICLNNLESEKRLAERKKKNQEQYHRKQTRKTLNKNNLRFHSSNAILKFADDSLKEPASSSITLPELKMHPSISPATDYQQKTKTDIVLPKLSQKPSDCGDTDSDSTVYCQLPSSIVPRLAFDGSGDFPSEDTCTCSNSDSHDTKSKTVPLPVKRILPRKRGVQHAPRSRKDGRVTPHHQGNRESENADYSGWSVTVAGTLELTRVAPDLEMRLSFPTFGSWPPQASQSDSGFAEDASQKRETVSPAGSMRQRWIVTVQNPNQGNAEGIKKNFCKNNELPALGQPETRITKKVLKSTSLESSARDCHGKISVNWPEVQLFQNQRLDEGTNSDALSVRGSAVPFEKKPQPQNMSGRGVTTRCTAGGRSAR